jgi:hypothetical protein
MIQLHVFLDAVLEVLKDKTVSIGGLFSTLSIFTGLTVDQVHKWVALYAVVVGAAGATVSLLIGLVKLWRILRSSRR